MRLYNEVEETTKVVVVEEYQTFNGLLKCKYLFYLLIAYTAFAVINAVLAFIDGGVFMAVVNILAHGAICASLWLNYLDNKNVKEEEKPSTKGTKIFQIAHAAKYIVVFVLLILGLILIVFSWIDAANLANQALVAAQGKVNADAELAAAKAAVNKVFWSYLLYLIVYLVFSIVTLVYYKAVMACVEGYNSYVEKGKHFWNDIKFLAIMLFVAAFLNVLFGLLSATGALNEWYGMMIKTNPEEPSYDIIAAAVGGIGWLSFVGRFLFAAICVCLGLLLFKGFKVLESTQTSHEEVLELGETDAPVEETAEDEQNSNDEPVEEVLQ